MADADAFSDRTKYTDGKVPDHRIRRLFCKFKIPESQRLAVAEYITEPDQLCNLGGNSKELEERIAQICGATWPGVAVERTINCMNWVCVWKACQSHCDLDADEEKEARRDPHKLTEIPDLERGQMWAGFSGRHPEINMIACKKPHRLFLESEAAVVVYCYC